MLEGLEKMSLEHQALEGVVNKITMWGCLFRRLTNIPGIKDRGLGNWPIDKLTGPGLWAGTRRYTQRDELKIKGVLYASWCAPQRTLVSVLV